MPFLVNATDYTDPEALNRRISVRNDHLEVAKKMESEGILHFGAAQMDSQNRMAGSILVYDLPTEADVRAAVESDIYWTAKVWESYTITEIRIAIPSA
jgi:uncharacterized protein YciI